MKISPYGRNDRNPDEPGLSEQAFVQLNLPDGTDVRVQHAHPGQPDQLHTIARRERACLAWRGRCSPTYRADYRWHKDWSRTRLYD